jgi:hypothetical protein
MNAELEGVSFWWRVAAEVCNDTSRRRWCKEAAGTPELTHIIFVATDGLSRGNISALFGINSLTSRTWECCLGRTLTRTSRRTRIENNCDKCLRL